MPTTSGPWEKQEFSLHCTEARKLQESLILEKKNHLYVSLKKTFQSHKNCSCSAAKAPWDISYLALSAKLRKLLLVGRNTSEPAVSHLTGKHVTTATQNSNFCFLFYLFPSLFKVLCLSFFFFSLNLVYWGYFFLFAL